MKRMLWALSLLVALVLAHSNTGYYPSSLLLPSAKAEVANLKNTDFISAKELKTLVDAKNPNLILIGVLNEANAAKPENLAGKPIDGSYTVWRPAYSGKNSEEAVAKEVSGFRKSLKEMEDLLSKSGATAESIIVAYAAGSMHDAARFYWQVKQLGHADARILDGGLDAWVAAGYPTGKGKKLVDEKPQSDYKATSYDTEAWGVTLQDVIAALNDSDEWLVLDTRSQGEVDGKKTRSSKGAFGLGGIKGVTHIEWTKALNKDKTLKSKEELEAIYGDIIKNKKIITFCQSGVRSAHTQAVLKEMLGAKAYNYDGSWLEWSYVASDASNGVIDPELKKQVKKLTTNWTDTKKPI